MHDVNKKSDQVQMNKKSSFERLKTPSRSSYSGEKTLSY